MVEFSGKIMRLRLICVKFTKEYSRKHLWKEGKESRMEKREMLGCNVISMRPQSTDGGSKLMYKGEILGIYIFMPLSLYARCTNLGKQVLFTQSNSEQG